MAKKAKKKAAAARNLQKDKRFPTSFPKPAPQEIVPATEIVVDGDLVVKETQACPHLEKGLNLEKFSLKVSALESLKCHDCRESVAERKPKKGKNKQGTNKGIGLNSKSESMTKWVCLECGCFSCGGCWKSAPQSHAARHAKQYRHPLVFQFGNPNLRWCFPCNTLIPVQRSEEDGELKDTLSEFVKVLKTRSHSSFQNRADVEGIWFGRGSVLGSVKSVNVLSTLQTSDNTGYLVRGLVNLGNTCFFNSVLQNLLAMDKLRDYFLKLEGSVGPLAASLKKLFAENIPSTGAKNVINPKAFLACVCAKAPQFRGFQQHDSHELLRCLLDGLCTEESRIQKRLQNGNTTPGDVNASPTFVDTIFGGQISSTVSCLECGHTSVVSEPYLDLSLPLPSKRSPSKKDLPVSRSKKPKLPPKRQGKFRPKTKKNSSDAQSVTTISISDESSGPAKSVETCSKQNGTSSSSLTQPESVVIDAVGNTNDAAVQNGIEQMRGGTVISSDKDNVVSNGQDSTVISSDKDIVVSNGQDSTVMSSDKDIVVSNGHDTTTHLTDSEVLVKVGFSDLEETPSWLDFLEASTSTVNDLISDNQDPSVTQDSGNSNDVVYEDEPQLIVQESEVILLPYEEFTSGNGGNEVILSLVTSEKEPSDFDGFGGLFDEPELDVGPTEIPLSNGVEESESDPEEVDDNDSPVSVEKCLAYFTTPELLTKTEHAWQCEQCSKSLFQKTKLENKLQIPVSDGVENGILTASANSGVDYLHSNRVGNGNEQITKNTDLALVNGNGEISQDTESCSVNGPTENSKNENGQHESDSSENEEVDSKSVKVARDATKRILISRAPRVLTIHLKRFCQDARGRLSKLNGHVNFRDTVDLKPYMDPSCRKDKETYKYSLVGVVEHSGSMRGGHYVAYVKGGAKDDSDTCSWYHASDAYVREVSLEEVLRCEAYILFYEEL